MIELVAQSRVDEIWPLIAPGFAVCLAKTPTDINAGGFWQMCRNGSAFLLICYEDTHIYSASVWRFEGSKFACLLLSGEDSGKWVAELFATAGTIAKENGAVALSASGRIGLVKMLNKNGVPAKVTRQDYEVEL